MIHGSHQLDFVPWHLSLASAMDVDESSPSSLHLCALVVFQNLLNEELIKSIHLYRGEDGTLSAIQREFMFCPSSYKQIGDAPIDLSVKDFIANLQQGEEHGLWICVLQYNYNVLCNKCTIPNILNTARNPCLKSIPELTIDLDRITRDSSYPQKCVGDDGISAEECESMDLQSNFLGIEGFWSTIPQLASVQDVFVESGATIHDVDNSYSITDICGEDNSIRSQPITQFLPGYSSFDLNQVYSSTVKCSLSSENEDYRTENKSRLSVAGSAVFPSIEDNFALEDIEIASYRDSSMLCSKSSVEELPKNLEKDENRRVHRAPTKRVASISLKDLAKCFDMPITEASRRLNVGLTVLKRKCREFGIPRWPHRKIKSLNSLIENLQEETKRQERKDQAAALAVKKRTRILETERQKIEKRPGTDIQKDTKRFRQDIFKRRHRARALEKKYESSDTNSDDGNSSVSTILTLMIDQASTSPSTK